MVADRSIQDVSVGSRYLVVGFKMSSEKETLRDISCDKDQDQDSDAGVQLVRCSMK